MSCMKLLSERLRQRLFLALKSKVKSNESYTELVSGGIARLEQLEPRLLMSVADAIDWTDDFVTVAGDVDRSSQGGRLGTFDGNGSYYSADEGSGIVLTDTSGNNQNGNILPGVTYTAGVDGTGLDFADNHDGVSLPGDMVNSDLGSVSLWFKTNGDLNGLDDGDHQMFYYAWDGDGGSPNGLGPNREMHFGIRGVDGNNDPSLFMYISNGNFFGNGSVSVESGSVNIDDGQWHHAVATWNGNGDVVVYLDGNEVGRESHTADQFDSEVVRIGRPQQLSGREFIGQMDEILVFDTEIDSATVSALAASPKPVTDAEVWGRISLEQDESVSVRLGMPGNDPSEFDLELYDVNENLLASSTVDGENVNRFIQGYTVSAAGDYFVRIAGAGTYELDVVKNALIEDEPNDDNGSAQALTPITTVQGFIGQGDVDTYSIDLNTGDILNLNTLMPQRVTPPQSGGPVTGTIFGFESSWSYLHPTDAVDPAVADTDFNSTWFTSGYDDSGWQTGIGTFGYGDINFQQINTDLGQPVEGNRYTAYFRKSFMVDEIPEVFTLNFHRDDAAIIYINGVEAARSREGGGTINFDTAPDEYFLLSEAVGDEGVVMSLDLDTSLFNVGENLISVSLHQANTSSSDVGFDAELMFSNGAITFGNSIGSALNEPGVGATSHLFTGGELGFQSSGQLFDDNNSTGVTALGEFEFNGDDIPSLTVSFDPVSLKQHNDVRVSLDIRSFEDSTGSDFEPEDTFSGRVVALDEDGNEFSFELFNLSGVALKDLGETLQTVSVDIPQGYDSLRVEVFGSVNSDSEHLYFDNLLIEELPALDPVIEVYRPDGVLIGVDDNSGADGNAMLSVGASLDGTYLIRVVDATSTGVGRYVLNGTVDDTATSFLVIDSDPDSGSTLTVAPTTVTIELSKEVDLATVQAGDLLIDGVPASGVTIVDADTLVFDIPFTIVAGNHTIEIAQGAMISDADTIPIRAFNASFDFITPPEFENIPATNITYTTAIIGGQLIDTGFSPTNFGLVWGDEDGGTNPTPGAWDNFVDFGIDVDPGIYTTQLSGLESNTMYFYRTVSQNDTGLYFGELSTFTTQATTPAILDLQRVNEITSTAASLGVDVIDNGGNDPQLLIYYGDEDGGTNPAAWDNAIDFGVVSTGSYQQTISGLLPETDYFYRAFVTNTGGDAWFDQVGTFQTLEPGLPVINELMADNETILQDEDGEYSDWLELYNPNPVGARDVSGWYLTDDPANLTQWQIPAGVSIDADGYLVVFASGKDRAVAGQELHTNFRLGNGGDYLALVRPDGTTVVHEYFPEYPSLDDDQAYGLIPGTLDQTFLEVPTPGAMNIVFDPNELVGINEIMFRPNTDQFTGNMTETEVDPDSPMHEWIELYNASSSDVNLNGWEFVSGINFVFPDVTIEAGGYLIVAADVATFNAANPGVTAPVVGGWTGQLSNSGEEIDLQDSTGERIDRVRYADAGDWGDRILTNVDGRQSWEWFSEADGRGSSLEVINPNQTNNSGQNWDTSTVEDGTPGAQNSVFANDVAPLIGDVTHFPVIPTPTDTVTITADINDELDAGLTVNLYYRTNGNGGYIQVPMFDDGLHGDDEAGDGEYGGEIPSLGAGTVVEYYVEASDTNGNIRTWPAPGLQVGVPVQIVNAMYQVEAQVATDTIPFYRLITTPDELNEFDDILDDDPGSNAQRHFTFISFDGSDYEVIHQAGVRNRGAGSRGRTPHNMRVSFPSDNLYNGVDGFNLNTQFPFAQVLGSMFMREAGLVQEDGRAVVVTLNGDNRIEPGDPATNPEGNLGFYAHMEKLDGSFVDNHYPLDQQGTLFRVQNAGFPIFQPSGDGEYSENQYQFSTNSEANDWSQLHQFFLTLNNAPDATFYEDVSEVMNVEQWMRFFAALSLMGHGENSVFNGRGDDMTIFVGKDDPRFEIIAHDFDTLFGQGDGSRQPIDMSLFRPEERSSPLGRLFENPISMQIYYEQLVDLIDTVFSKAEFDNTFDRYMGDLVPNGLRNEMINWMDGRRDWVLTQIPVQFTLNLNVPSTHGIPHYTGGPLMASGGLDGSSTHRVLVNGIEGAASVRNGNYSVTNGAVQTFNLIPTGSEWKYLDDGSNQGTAWRSTGFNDSTWASGNAELGYGDGDETTVVSFGPDDNNKYPTTYFRKTINLSAAQVAEITNLSLDIKYDDGMIVYINGIEVARSDNMIGVNSFDEYATGNHPSETEFFTYDNLGTLLEEGDNVIAVEVHQDNGNSSDISFDFELNASGAAIGNQFNLVNGLNLIRAESMNEFEGVVDTRQSLLWYDVGGRITVSNPISINTNWTSNTLRVITGDFVIEEGARLTIEAGTTIFMQAGASIQVDGELVINGTDEKPVFIWPDLNQATPGAWDGIDFTNPTANNRITSAFIALGNGDGDLLNVDGSSLTVEDSFFLGDNNSAVIASNADLHLSNNFFEFASGNIIEGSGIMSGGAVVIEGNTFGTTVGEGSAIQWTGPAPTGAAVGASDLGIQVLDNNFTGGQDDAVRILGAQAFIEGNRFWNYRKGHVGAEASSAILVAGNGAESSDVWIANNAFIGNDHGVMVLDDSFVTAKANTFVSQFVSGFAFSDTDSVLGMGAEIHDSIFYNNFNDLLQTEVVSELTINHSIVSPEFHSFGTGNLDLDPLLQEITSNPTPMPGSAAYTAGAFDQLIGYTAERGLQVFNGPDAVTAATGVSLSMSGAGFSHYQYVLDGGTVVGPIEFGETLNLNGLGDGVHMLSISGITPAGVIGDPVVLNWEVDSALAHVRINEILAINNSTNIGGLFPDLVELYNPGEALIDISGWMMSDNPENPDKHTFASGTTIGAGSYLTLIADNQEIPGHLDLQLDGRSGETLYLYNSLGELVDEITFGMQVADRSIGVLDDGSWGLTVPTFGLANVPQAVGTPHNLSINEWLTFGDQLINDDFIEIYNPDNVYVDISGVFLTDDPDNYPDLSEIPSLSFLLPQSHTLFEPDGDPEDGAEHLDFRLSGDLEAIGLFDHDLNRIDVVYYGPQRADISEGRFPDGQVPIVFFDQPTPGERNAPEGVPYIDFDATWRYLDDGSDQGSTWRQTAFDDSSWGQGAGILGFENAILPDVLRTELNPGEITYYFRTTFDYQGDTAGALLNISTILDDGAIIYLNDSEVLRVGMNGGGVNSSTLANRAVGDATVEDFFGIVPGLLRQGINTLAVEVHQSSAGSSDMVFGLELSIVPPPAAVSNNDLLLENLRVTEMMVNPPDGEENEFIELQNVGSDSINLDGVRFTNGIDFTFGDITLLPGEYVVVASDFAAFIEKYGMDKNVAGQYGGQLDNQGERVTLTLPDPFITDILDFEYEVSWFGDDVNRSLNMMFPGLDVTEWENAANWDSSINRQGTPDGSPLIVDPTDDGVFNAADIDAIAEAVRDGDDDPLMDMNRDGEVTLEDRDELILGILRTIGGDATLDRIVNLEDLARLATFFGMSGQGWAQGDFTGDGVVNLEDLARLATNFGLDVNPPAGMGAGEMSEPVQSSGSEATVQTEIEEEGDVDLISPVSELKVNTEAILNPVAQGDDSGDSSEPSWDHIGNLLNEDDSVQVV